MASGSSEGNRSKPALDIDALEQLLLGQTGDNEEDKDKLKKLYKEATMAYHEEPRIKRPCGGNGRSS